jgi:hypothetical protein
MWCDSFYFAGSEGKPQTINFIRHSARHDECHQKPVTAGHC